MMAKPMKTLELHYQQLFTEEEVNIHHFHRHWGE